MPSPNEFVVQDLTFSYPGAEQPLFENLSVSFLPGFTGIVGANGAGKSTLLKLIAGELAPDAGSLGGALNAVYCEQRTDTPPAVLQDFFEDYSGEAHRLREQLGIHLDFALRWSTLSHGERKRAQIATALWQAPEVLAIDEPTNHIDAVARQLLIDALSMFQGIGLIVSHDRAMLDQLCQRCLWLEPPVGTLYAGGYSLASQARDAHLASAIHERQQVTRAYAQLQKEAVKRGEKASRANRERSKRNISAKDHDAKDKINLARASGKDGQAGRLLRQLDGRLDQLKSAMDASAVQKTYETGIWLPGSTSQRDHVLLAPAGDIQAGEHRLSFPELRVRPTDRISITGTNGSGKSTLLRHLHQFLNIEPDRLIDIPQEIALEQSQKLIEDTRQLPKEQLGQVMAFVSRLGSRPGRLMESASPSPGETRKLMLALGMLRAPHLIIMDEPTNHMDLPSIEALENALASCPCALILVSHDERFLDGITDTEWRITRDSENCCDLVTQPRQPSL